MARTKLEWANSDPRETDDLYVVRYSGEPELVVKPGKMVQWPMVQCYIKLPPLPDAPQHEKQD